MIRRAATLLAVGLLLAPLLPATPAAAQGPDVTVLADFGDGTYLWTDVTLPASNVTALKATELANASWGLPPLEVTWFPFGAFVDDLGNRDPVYPVYWHFYVWNRSEGAWDISQVGPSDTDLADGDTIAWYLGVDDPDTFASPRPVPTPDFPDAWTSFRGDLRNRGVARGTVPVTNALLWERDVGVLEIDTTPVVAYRKVFVGTRNALVALDAESGVQVWRNPRVRSLLSTAAVYDGMLILGGTDGKLWAVEASSGADLWSVLIEPGAVSTGIASSPAIHEGRAYVGTFNESAGGMGKVVGVNLDNGTVAWTYETGSVHLSSPAIAGGALYLGVMGVYDGDIGYAPPYGLLSLHLNGTRNWFFATDGSVASSPVLADDQVVFTAKDGYLYVLHLDGTLAWRRTIGPATSTPAIVGNTIFAASGGFDGEGALYAYDLAGNLRWQAPTGGSMQASLVSDGVLVCGASNVAVGRHACFRASDGALAWDYTPVPTQYILGSPVVVGDTLYAPSDNGRVYAFRDGPPAENPLLGLDLDVPSEFIADSQATLTVSYGSLGRGRAVDVTLRVAIPAGLRLDNETTGEAAFPRIATISLGELGPGENGSREFRVVPLPGFALFPIAATLSYADLAGRPYPDVAETVQVRGRTGLEIPPILLWLLVAVLAAAVLSAVALAAVRRRGPEGEGGAPRA